MRGTLKKILATAFEKCNIGIISFDRLQRLQEFEREDNVFLDILNNKTVKAFGLIDKSKAQLKQDLFALTELDFKRDGFFVEFGAANGIELSNTYLLEKEFGWRGILSEPAKGWYSELNINRSCHIETSCVWRDSISKLNFNEVDIKELSTIDIFNDSDNHRELRSSSKNYIVNTISLLDLLEKYNAPKIIDYLSIDTEGSEYDILSSFDFSKYSFRTITVEHNYTKNREKLFNLLAEKGYSRKYISFSKWDDWYVKVGK